MHAKFANVHTSMEVIFKAYTDDSVPAVQNCPISQILSYIYFVVQECFGFYVESIEHASCTVTLFVLYVSLSVFKFLYRQLK